MNTTHRHRTNALALLALEDESIFVGYAFGADASAALPSAAHSEALLGFGEVVINTAMTGYPEVLTDTSYRGQILVMTAAHIGNYGVDAAWSESRQEDGDAVQVNGCIVRAYYDGVLPYAPHTLGTYLKNAGVPALCDVDTRALTLHIREHGALMGMIVRAPEHFSRWDDPYALPQDFRTALRARILALKQCYRYDLVNRVPHKALPYTVHAPTPSTHAVLYDCGCKRSIVAHLQQRNCTVTVVPHTWGAEEIQAQQPELVILSNGPGDPAPLQKQVDTIRALVGVVPILAICMGHQLLAQALGARTYKLPFGHHGVNHPVHCSTSDRLFVTSQNHEYAVDADTLPAGLEIWFRNANDDTIEGIIDQARHIYSVQFHPEAAPGPHDTLWIFSYVLERIAAIAHARA